MHRHTRSDTGDMSSRSSRASFSSDRPSVASSVTFQMPSTVRPLPAYIAASVASQMVTDHHNAQLRDADADTDGVENAVLSAPALGLLNAFLDHLLFAFLSTARSPALAAMRPAISEVLKPRLARVAMEAADEELQGLLAGDDAAAADLAAHDGRPADRWDVEKVWKRTRLRIMVYTRLGELEDDDEDRYVQQERGLSMDDDDADEDAGLVSWASAIFLTSVVEYVAEKTLLVSGQAAFARMAAKTKKLGPQPDGADAPAAERLVVEETDVEKIALSASMGRLWRTWRKRVRSPVVPPPSARGIPPMSSYSSLHRRHGSDSTADYPLRRESSFDSTYMPTETQIAANIPLPMRDDDVNEIEVPGLAPACDAESIRAQTPVPRPQRTTSAIILAPAESFRRLPSAERPVSLPVPATSPFAVLLPAPVEELEAPFETPMMAMFPRPPRMAAHGRDDASEASGANESRRESDSEADAAMVAFAASTGMGLRMSTVDPFKAADSKHVEHEPEIAPDSYESEPKIMHSKRMSVEKIVFPGLVRTLSMRSSILRSPRETPVTSPNASQHGGRSYLDDSQSDDGFDDPRAIGFACTSDLPIRNMSTSVEHFVDRGKFAVRGGYVDPQSRRASSSSMSARISPTSEDRPVVPARSLMRSRSSYDGQGSTSLLRDPAMTEPKTRSEPLPALQEVDVRTSTSHQRVASENSQRISLSFANPKRILSYHSRESPASVTERKMQHSPTEHSGHSTSSLHRSSSERSVIQRIASFSSSTKKSDSSSIIHSSLESESQRLLSNRLSEHMSEVDRERQFDSLVKGQETVKYMITPANMRDPESPIVQKVDPDTPSTASFTLDFRGSSERDHSIRADKLLGRAASRNKGSTAAQHKPSPSRKVITKPLAREPRIESESILDFADFIRSTGPSPGQEKPVKPFVNINSKSANSSSTSIGHNASTKQSNRKADVPTLRPRVSMEPRSPAGLSGGNDDLIDFIRQGPLHNGHPRINRSIAPFRTTIDSDQFESMLGGHVNIEAVFDSRASTLNSKHSTQTVNSRTGLLPVSSVVQPAYSNTPPTLSGHMASNSEPHITRTRRRVKDPYAIDYSDEEDEDDNENEEEDEDELTALPYSSQPKQENLMDFLNGMDPPSTGKPQPFMLSEETIAAAKARANSSSRPQTGRAPATTDARMRSATTNDLADFLLNSGPPEVPLLPTRKEGAVEQEKKRRFWRSKKSSYPDLP